MKRPQYIQTIFFLPALVAGLLTAPIAVAAPDVPETVIVTYQTKPHEEAALLQVLEKHWQVARQLKLVKPSPHVLLQREDNGKSYYVEVFTWRDASIPDNAPEPISMLWQQMGQLTEARDGKAAIDFTAVKLLGD